MLKICADCGTGFSHGYKNRIYCSSACNKRAWKKRNPNHRKEDYARNAERYKQKAREWGIANAKRKQARNRADYKANPEKVGAMFRKWKANNPEKMQAARDKWAAENQDRIKEKNIIRRRNNREKIRATTHRRRARINNSTIGNQRIILEWESAWRRKNSVRCYWCGKSFNGKRCHTDHIVAITNGGSHAIENLCISCAPCNQRKNRRSIEKWNLLINNPVLL